MKDYTLLQKWTPTTKEVFQELFHEFDNNEDLSECWLFNSLEELVDELEYQGLDFKEIVQLTKNRYGNVIDIIEYDSAFYIFIGGR